MSFIERKFNLSCIEVITINKSERWDEIVKSFKAYDVYYLSRYVKAFQVHGDGDPILFYYEDDYIKAMNVVMKRDIQKDKNFLGKIESNTYFDITTPYGYGGFILEGEITNKKLKDFNEKYTKLCRKQGIVSEFVRFHPVTNNVNGISSIYDCSKLGRTITMQLNSQSQIWDELTSKNRNVIRKALKSGVEIYWGRDSKLFDKFIKLYDVTMDRDDAKDYYYFEKNFYDSILLDLRYNSLIFYAMYEGEIISMAIILFSNKQMHYHLSASEKKYMNLAPNNLLLYEAACWGCENGYKTLHLGGGLASKEDNLFRFKKSFNKNSNTYFSIGRKIFDKERYDDLVRIRKNDKSFKGNAEFFPIYRG